MQKFTFILCLFISISSYANVQLPLLFSDDMVLQRDKSIPVWGWADANEQVSVYFKEQVIHTKADKKGNWTVNLKPEQAGGPFKFTVKGKNTIILDNVLVGDVWICSGQSNMEWPVSSAMNFDQELKDADFPMIRHFLVERDMSGIPKSKLKNGQWEVCNKNTVGGFTAVGYFFAKKLHKETNIPIGIIHTSWGGTCVETWTSKEAFQGSQEFSEMIAGLPSIDIDALAKNQKELITKRIEKVLGSKIAAQEETLFKEPGFNDVNWPEMQAPGLWETQQLIGVDGVVWMRKTVEISKEDAHKPAEIALAKIDDDDITYINGIEVGATNRYDTKRVYEIPAQILKEGKNVIAIRIVDYVGGGGIWGDEADLKLTTQSAVIPLSGEWKFNVVEIISSLSPNSYPSLLYNAMVNPLIPYAFQGVLWYQGEANVGRAEQYKKAFPLMIEDWRQKWGQGDFPFYFVQLSSFNEHNGNSNKGSKWAELREAQTQALQTVPKTGMCVTTDIGNADDIHPTNKQDVGKRLAAIALNQVYKKDIVFSGPIYKSMEVKEKKIVITFDHIGSGLTTPDKYGYLRGFEIAGKDKVFHFAKAHIRNNKVVVYHESITAPVAVRFGWADDAGECNLYNVESFPASPFRTDDWPLITKDESYFIEVK